MNRDSDLKQRLLEMEYGLLEPEEETVLRRRIADEPETEKLLHDVRALKNDLAAAVQWEAPPIALSKHAAQPVATSEIAPAPSNGKRRGLPNRLLGLAASVLLIGSIAGYVFPWTARQEGDGLRLAVRGPQTWVEGVPQQIEAITTSADQTPVDATIDYTVSGSGDVLATRRVAAGQRAFVINAPVGTSDDVSVEIAATSGELEASYRFKPRIEPETLCAYLACDQGEYAPGETVRYRATVLGRHTKVPRDGLSVAAAVRDAVGRTVATAAEQTQTIDGVALGEIPLPSDLDPGRYALTVSQPQDRFAAVERAISIVPQNLNVADSLRFHHERYAPGDAVIVEYQATDLQGAPLAAKPIAVRVQAAERRLLDEKTLTSGDGRHRIRFQLPDDVQPRDCQVQVAYLGDRTGKTLTAGLPDGELLIEVFPEGGRLTAGAPNRVYVLAFDGAGQPTQTHGVVVDQSQQPIAEIESISEGVGIAEWIPRAESQYFLSLSGDATTDDRRGRPLPVPTLDFPATVSVAPTFDPSQGVRGTIHCREAATIALTASSHGIVVGRKIVACQARETTFHLPLDEATAGTIVRLSATETGDDGDDSPRTPGWQRLVFAAPLDTLALNLKTSSGRFGPGDRVQVEVQSRDRSGVPQPATLGLAVVDERQPKSLDPPLAIQTLLSELTFERPETLKPLLRTLAETHVQSGANLEPLLGTLGAAGRSLIEETALATGSGAGDQTAAPTLFDNLQTVRDQIETQAAAAARRFQKLAANAAFFGGLGALFLVLILATVAGKSFSPATLSAATACLLAGSAMLFDLPSREGPQLAMEDAARPRFEHAAEPLGEGLAHTAEDDRFAESTEAPESSAIAEDSAAERTKESLDRKESGIASVPPADNRQAEPLAPMKSLAPQQVPSAPRRSAIVPLAPLAESGASDRQPRTFAGEPASAPVETDEMAATPMAPPAAANRLSAMTVVGSVSGGFPSEAPTPRVPLYWQPRLTTDESGAGNFEFTLPDRIGAYRVTVNGHTAGGLVGDAQLRVFADSPFNFNAAAPSEVNAGDKLELPVVVSNSLADGLEVDLRMEGGDRFQPETTGQTVKVDGHQNVERRFIFDVTGVPGLGSVEIEGRSGDYKKRTRQLVRIQSPGYPAQIYNAGVLEKTHRAPLGVPSDALADSTTAVLRVFPTFEAEAVAAAHQLDDEREAGVEAIASAVYPHLAILSSSASQTALPGRTRTSRRALENAAQTLTSFQRNDGGFGRYSADSVDPAITAYAWLRLRQIQTTAAVKPAVQEAIDRAENWLLQNYIPPSEGVANTALIDAFTLWASTQAGTPLDALSPLIERVANDAERTDDPCRLALAAYGLRQSDRIDEAEQAMQRLQEIQGADGSLPASGESITGVAGPPLQIETTALAAIAWKLDPKYADQVEQAARWLRTRREGKGFGSTFATALTLQALQPAETEERLPGQTARVRALLEDQVVAEEEFLTGDLVPLELEFHGWIVPGSEEITLDLGSPQPAPYSLAVEYRLPAPALSEATDLLESQVELSETAVKAGEAVRLNARFSNPSDDQRRFVVAELSLPAGLSVVQSSIEEIAKRRQIDHWEIRGRSLRLYWNAIDAGQQVELSIELQAALAGEFSGAASSVFPYYAPDQRHWIKPLRIAIEGDDREVTR